MRFLELLHY